MLEILAVLSVSAAVGLRIGLPLLLIGLLRSNLWYDVPLLSQLSPRVVIGVLVSCSLFELLASKQLLGQRILQVIELTFSPIVGAITGMAIARAAELDQWQVNLLGLIGGLFALVLQLVQAGWFFRLRGLPFWAILAQDLLCVLLVLFAFDAPQQGGLIALILLWLAIRSSSAWYGWYVKRGKIRIMR